MKTGISNVPPSGQVPIPSGIAARFQLLNPNAVTSLGASGFSKASNRLATLILTDDTGAIALQFSDNGIHPLPPSRKWTASIVALATATPAVGEFTLAWQVFDSVQEILNERSGMPVDSNGNVPVSNLKRWRVVLDTTLNFTALQTITPLDTADCSELLLFQEAAGGATATGPVTIVPISPLSHNPGGAALAGADGSGGVGLNGIVLNMGGPALMPPLCQLQIGPIAGMTAGRFSVIGR